MKALLRLTPLLVLLITVPAIPQVSPVAVSLSAKAADPEWTEFQASMARMHASMASTAPSGNGDIDFVKLMLPHHQAAIEMAKIQLIYGKDPKLRRLAQEIITDQQSEIELMQLWLKEHDSSAASNKAPGHQ